MHIHTETQIDTNKCTDTPPARQLENHTKETSCVRDSETDTCTPTDTHVIRHTQRHAVRDAQSHAGTPTLLTWRHCYRHTHIFSWTETSRHQPAHTYPDRQKQSHKRHTETLCERHTDMKTGPQRDTPWKKQRQRKLYMHTRKHYETNNTPRQTDTRTNTERQGDRHKDRHTSTQRDSKEHTHTFADAQRDT